MTDEEGCACERQKWRKMMNRSEAQVREQEKQKEL